jgi:hypothetical protein
MPENQGNRAAVTDHDVESWPKSPPSLLDNRPGKCRFEAAATTIIISNLCVSRRDIPFFGDKPYPCSKKRIDSPFRGR